MLSGEKEEIEMQLMNTQVREPSDGMIIVEFQGEGGELVAVKMATGEDLDGGTAILRAKAIMVQLSSFDERRQAGDNIDERTEGLSETEPKLPEVSSFGDAPSSSA
jgi:hypothetical protein